MALTYTPAATADLTLPPFLLPAVDGGTVDSSGLTRSARATLVAFICNHCPYVMAIESRLIALAAEFRSAGLVTLGICANDDQDHPEDAPAELFRRWREQNYGFPYAIDHQQTVARAFGAVCTPDFFLFDAAGTLAYRGRLDDSWRNAAAVGRRELAEAVNDVLNHRPVVSIQNPSMGCSIKWRT